MSKKTYIATLEGCDCGDLPMYNEKLIPTSAKVLGVGILGLLGLAIFVAKKGAKKAEK